MKFALKTAVILLVVISLGMQAYILVMLVSELVILGHTGIITAFGYSASLTLSPPTYFMAILLNFCMQDGVRMKWIHACYFGSHLIILACMFALPGNFV